MAIYAIGDVQGCCSDLDRLLEKIAFDAATDRLWFTGDLVNRGPQSLDALRRVVGLGSAAITVLGNHDIHLLAVAAGVRKARSKDTLDAILQAADADTLLGWLRHRPLAHFDETLDTLMVHAGLPPQWDAGQAVALSREVEQALQADDWAAFLGKLFAAGPDRWRDRLHGTKRLRFIANAMTRIRYCDRKGRLQLESKGPPGTQPAGLYPWFDVPERRSAATRVVVGHWATLGYLSRPDLLALDSGCVWGGKLTAVRLDAPADAVQVSCSRFLTPKP